MKRKNLTKLLLLGGAAALLCYGGYSLASSLPKEEAKEVEATILYEEAGEDLLTTEEASIPLLNSVVTDSDTDALETTNEDTILNSAIMAQFGEDTAGKKCIRFVVAVAHLDVNVTFTRTLVLSDGTKTSKNIKATTAYQQIKVAGVNKTADLYNKDLDGDSTIDTDYQYFVCYTMSGFTDDYATLAVSAKIEDLRKTSDTYENQGTNCVFNKANVKGLTLTSGEYCVLSESRTTYEGLVYEYVSKDEELMLVGTTAVDPTSVSMEDSLVVNTEYNVVKEIPVTSIERTTFYGQKSLTTVKLSNNLKTIGYEAFYGTSIAEITLPNGLKTIDSGVFKSCEYLTSIVIPDSVTSVGDYCFSDGALDTITIGSGLATMGAYAFGTNLENITISKDNKVYDSRNDCNAIIRTKDNCLVYGSDNTVIPDDIVSIASRAFYRSCIKSVTIPASVTSIASDAFYMANSIESIIVAEGNKVYDSRGGCKGLIKTDTNTLLAGGSETVIPSTVTKIADKAFYGNCVLTEIAVPDGVTTIGSEAFSCCYYVESISISSTVTSIGSAAFSSLGTATTINYNGTKEEWNAISIGDYAFSWSTIKTIHCTDGDISLED